MASVIGRTVSHHKVLKRLGRTAVPSFRNPEGVCRERNISLQFHHSDNLRDSVTTSHYKDGRWALAIVYFSLVLVSRTLGQMQNIAFERISVEQGLVSPTVYCIFQDSRGFMWFGTDDGLCRYEGTRFKVYDRTPVYARSVIHEDKHGSLWICAGGGELHRFDITSEKIIRYHIGIGHRALSIFESANGDIWISTMGDGLAKYRRADDSFETYTHDPRNATTLCNDTVYTICEDKNGILWVGTGNGMDRFERMTGTFVHCDEGRGNRVFAIIEDRAHSLWLGTDDGLCRFDGSRTTFERYRDTDRERNTIRFLLEDSRNELWVTSEGGLARFDRSTNRFMIARASRGDSPMVLHPFPHDPILEDRMGTVWVSIDAVGLGMFDQEKQAFEVYTPNPRDPRALPEKHVTCMFEDRSGTIWLGMWNTGVCKLQRVRVPFVHIAQNPHDKIQLSSRLVTSILEDGAGALWVGSSDGLDRLDLTTGARVHYRADPKDSHSLSHRRILALAEDGRGKLWVGTMGGLNTLNPATGTFARFTLDSTRPGSISSASVQSIYFDKAGTMWLGGGMGSGILEKFNRTDGTFTCYDVREYGRTGPHASPIMSVHEDMFGGLWFLGRGLGGFDRGSGRAKYYRRNGELSGSLSNEEATSLCENAQGVLWIGTNAGLDRFDRGSETFSHITVKGGLASNYVLDILEDSSGSSHGEGPPGNLWLLTVMGISKFTPSTGAIRNYGPADGVPIAASAWAHACFKNGNGYMYFGGTNGFVRFHPDSVHDNLYVPPIVITAFKKFYRDAELDSAVTEKKAIELSYREDVFSLEFAALDYIHPEKNQYAYKLEGFDKDWVYCGTSREATYTNLDPGTYTFRVKGSNHDGVWNEAGTSLTVIINPAFWQTLWFKAGLVLLFPGVLYALYRYRLSKLLDLQRLRLRIADDLHDEIGSELSGIALESDLIARQLQRATPQHLRLTNVGRSIRAAADNLRDVVWVVNPELDTVQDLVARLRAIAAKMLAGHQLTFESSTNPSWCSLDLEFKRHVIMMFKEILNNILCHASATHVHIELNLKEKHLHLSVNDDGVGFTPSSHFTGRGLAALRSRAAAIGGKLTLESKPGSGTHVCLEADITRSSD